jgi:6-phosphofructo-2-kinase
VVQYEAVYEEVVDEEDGGNVSFIKIYNVGQKVVTRRCSGYIPSQVAFHLMNVHVSPRKIWLSRHAEGTDQMRGLLGGDSGEMTRYGEEYAFQLAQYVSDSIKELRAQRKRSRSREESSNANAPGAQQQQPQSETEAPGTPSSRVQFTGSVEEEPLDSDEYRGDELVVMLGTQAIHHSTVKHVMAMNPDVKFVSNSILNELRGGELDKMSHSEIKQKYPQVWEARMKDKLHFRYPGAGGESYIDVIQRVKPVIVELERQRKSVLVVSHLAVQRCL